MSENDIKDAIDLVQEFKRRWMALPTFADKLPRKTREGMTVAHMPIMQLEQLLLSRAAANPPKEQA